MTYHKASHISQSGASIMCNYITRWYVMFRKWHLFSCLSLENAPVLSNNKPQLYFHEWIYTVVECCLYMLYMLNLGSKEGILPNSYAKQNRNGHNFHNQPASSNVIILGSSSRRTVNKSGHSVKQLVIKSYLWRTLVVFCTRWCTSLK